MWTLMVIILLITAVIILLLVVLFALLKAGSDADDAMLGDKQYENIPKECEKN